LNNNVLDLLNSEVQWEEIESLGVKIFKEGNLSLVDDLIVLVIPLLNIVYYNHIVPLDDRHHAKDDLIQDALMEIYRDMKLHWDKYIYVDIYCQYITTIARSKMIDLVHRYHNYYSTTEYDPEILLSTTYVDNYSSIETKILREEMQSSIISIARRILKCRKKHSRILETILESTYLDKSKDVRKLYNRFRVIGISEVQFKLLKDHVDYVYKLSYNYQKSIVLENSKMRLRIEDVISRFESPTYEILSSTYSDSIIPEIYAEFGPEVTRKFVRTFSDKTVKVPDYQDFCDHLLGSTVLSLSKGDKDNLYQLSADYKIPYRALSRIYNKVSKFIKK